LGDVGERFGPVWRRLRRLDIERRNLTPFIDVDAGGRVAIACGGTTHEASVAGSELVLHDHDVGAELALLALGSALPACLVYAAVWEEGLRSERFLRGWADDVEGELVRAAREDWVGNYWEYWPTDPTASRVLFGPRLQDRLASAAAERAVGDALSAPSDAARVPMVVRATQTRARRAFVRSLAVVDAHRRPDALVPVRIRVTPSAPASAGGRLSQDGSGVDLRLPLDWLWTVWSPGLAVVEDRLVLARHGDVLQVVDWRPTGRRALEHAPVLTIVRMGTA
jgi:hypothetical protein